MATRTRKAAKKTVKKDAKFLVLVSECGNDEQLMTVDRWHPVVTKPTLAEAKGEADAVLASMSDEGETPERICIAQIVAEGQPIGLVWCK